MLTIVDSVPSGQPFAGSVQSNQSVAESVQPVVVSVCLVQSVTEDVQLIKEVADSRRPAEPIADNVPPILPVDSVLGVTCQHRAVTSVVGGLKVIISHLVLVFNFPNHSSIVK